nr:MarR family transcriptional regulator [Salsipaludibacter albus]
MAHRARAAALLATIGLHPGQEFLLAALGDHGPCAIGELADMLAVEQPTVTKMVRRLEPHGHVERGPDPGDGRRTLVSLTPTGREALASARELWRRLDDETTAGLTSAEQADLRRLLRRVRASLQD